MVVHVTLTAVCTDSDINYDNNLMCFLVIVAAVMCLSHAAEASFFFACHRLTYRRVPWMWHSSWPVAGGAVPGNAVVLQDRADLAGADVNISDSDADAAQKAYVRSLVQRSDIHSLIASIALHQCIAR